MLWMISTTSEDYSPLGALGKIVVWVRQKKAQKKGCEEGVKTQNSVEQCEGIFFSFVYFSSFSFVRSFRVQEDMGHHFLP